MVLVSGLWPWSWHPACGHGPVPFFYISQHSLFTCIHKHYSVEDWLAFVERAPQAVAQVAVSSGSGDEDYIKLKGIVKAVPGLQYICLDVANGYSEHFVSFVRRARKDFPEHTIMVSLCCYGRPYMTWVMCSGGQRGDWRNGRRTYPQWS